MPSQQGIPDDKKQRQENHAVDDERGVSKRDTAKDHKKEHGRTRNNNSRDGKGQSGAEDGKPRGGLLGAFVDTVKAGLTGEARHAEDHSSKESTEDGRRTRKTTLKRTQDVDTPDLKASRSRPPDPAGIAMKSGTEGVEQDTPEPQSKEVKRARFGSDISKGSKREDKGVEDAGRTREQKQKRRASHASIHKTEHRSEDGADAQSAADNFDTAERKPEQQRRHAMDRLYDITSKLKGDKGSTDGTRSNTAGWDDDIARTKKSSATELDGAKAREATDVRRGTRTGRFEASKQTDKPKGNWDDQHTCTDAGSARTSLHTTAYTVHTSSREIVETRCARCGDWIAFDVRTRELVDLSLLPPEICLTCGQPWPRNKELTDEMTAIINKRLDNPEIRKKYGDVFCERCAASESIERQEQEAKSAAAQNVEDGVQVDERDLQANDPDWRGDHYCKKLDFERDKDNLESRRFPVGLGRSKGTKKALLIGINYSAQPHELKGCRNDVANMYRYLRSNGYKDENIEILLDIRPYRPPTKQNIVKYMGELVKNVEPGDSLFLHYSGHGGQTKDQPRTAITGKGENTTGDEADGKDECIYPVDYKRISNGMLVDDEMHAILTQIPKGVQLTALFDSCHSGSVLDLPYVLTNDGTMKRTEFRKPHTREAVLRINNCGTIILWSGCKDTQTSKDTKIGRTAVGAMSHAFIQANQELLEKRMGKTSTRSKITSSKTQIEYTYDELLVRVRELLRQRSQVPQLSSAEDLKPYQRRVAV